MPLEVYNAEGEPVEGVLTQAEADAAVAAKEAELTAQLEETKTKLAGLENKEFNFRRLEDMTEADKAKLSATELSLKQKQEELEKQQIELHQGYVSDVKNDVLESLVGDDEELRKKVEFNYSRLKDSDKATKRSEIKPLMEEALAMSIGVKSGNPLRSAINAGGSAPVKSAEKISPEVANVGKMMGLTDEDLKNA